MRRIYHCLSSFCLATVLVITAASAGCAGRVRIYDDDHRDWHQWNRDEDVQYRRYLGERHEDYREYSKLKPDEQKDYWNWRHGHSDSDNH